MFNFETKEAELQNTFDNLKAEQSELQKRLEAIDHELYRLQGEYRMLQQLKTSDAIVQTNLPAPEFVDPFEQIPPAPVQD